VATLMAVAAGYSGSEPVLPGRRCRNVCSPRPGEWVHCPGMTVDRVGPARMVFARLLTGRIRTRLARAHRCSAEMALQRMLCAGPDPGPPPLPGMHDYDASRGGSRHNTCCPVAPVYPAALCPGLSRSCFPSNRPDQDSEPSQRPTRLTAGNLKLAVV
jgi:hypothetical protein